MNIYERSVLYKLVHLPAIIDEGVEGLKGVDGANPLSRSSVHPEYDFEQIATSREGNHNLSDLQNMEAEATFVGYQENGGAWRAPYLSISLDGSLVSKELDNGDLCISRGAMEQLIHLLLSHGNTCPPKVDNGDSPDRLSSIVISCDREQNKKQVHILFPRAKKALSFRPT